MFHRLHPRVLLFALGLGSLAACSSHSVVSASRADDSGTGAADGEARKPDAGTPASDSAVAPPTADGGGETSGKPDAGELDVRAEAAASTAMNHASCQAIAPFYWEIGDAHDVLASGSIGSSTDTTTYEASTAMEIASASKWIFGAYVVERFKDDLGAIDLEAITMRSGYSNFSDPGCSLAKPQTVQGCLDGGTKGKVDPDPDTKGSFAYSGGHFQKYAVDLGLGALDAQGLADEVEKVLGPGLGIGYRVPMLAGGARLAAENYRAFLQKVLRGKLAIAAHLGEQSVCTLPPAQGGGTCMATYSPAAPYAWHYSYGHWVEDGGSAGDDGAFSSAGKFGFYPWIDAQRKHYGIVARKSQDAKAGGASAECGRALRAAFKAAKAQ